LRLVILAEVGCLHALTFNLFRCHTLKKVFPAEAYGDILLGTTQQLFLVPDQDGESVPDKLPGLRNPSDGILRRLLQVR
jgi:hypothetical protein